MAIIKYAKVVNGIVEKVEYKDSTIGAVKKTVENHVTAWLPIKEQYDSYDPLTEKLGEIEYLIERNQVLALRKKLSSDKPKRKKS